MRVWWNDWKLFVCLLLLFIAGVAAILVAESELERCDASCPPDRMGVVSVSGRCHCVTPALPASEHKTVMPTPVVVPVMR